jgi:hypothetical protein
MAAKKDTHARAHPPTPPRVPTNWHRGNGNCVRAYECEELKNGGNGLEPSPSPIPPTSPQLATDPAPKCQIVPDDALGNKPSQIVPNSSDKRAYVTLPRVKLRETKATPEAHR